MRNDALQPVTDIIGAINGLWRDPQLTVAQKRKRMQHIREHVSLVLAALPEENGHER